MRSFLRCLVVTEANVFTIAGLVAGLGWMAGRPNAGWDFLFLVLLGNALAAISVGFSKLIDWSVR